MTPGPPFATSEPARLPPRPGVSAVVLWADGEASGPSCAINLGQRARRLRRADSRVTSRTRVESGAISHPGGHSTESHRLSMGGAETHAVARVLATNHRAPPVSVARRGHGCGNGGPRSARGGAVGRRCCMNRHGPARCQSTGFLPADAIRRWFAAGGHPIQDLTAEDGLTPLPSWTPGAKVIADDGLVAEERVLHPALTMAP